MYDNIVVYLQPTKFKGYLNDPRLTLKAKGLMSVICEMYALGFTNPFPEHFNIERLRDGCREHWKTVNSAFEELVALGYAKRDKIVGTRCLYYYTINEGGGLNDSTRRG